MDALAMTKVVGFAMAIIGKRDGQSLYFTLHPSNFTLPSLAFLVTYTEAYVVVAETGGGVEALS